MPDAPRDPPETTVSWPFSTTAERLLEERSLSEISVDDLAKGAGISRPTFYFYFPSKEAVLLTLVERVIAEADRNADEAMGGMDASVDPAGVWKAINALFSDVRLASRGHPRRRGFTPDEPRGARAVVAVHAEVDRPHHRRPSRPNATGVPRRRRFRRPILRRR